MALIDLSEVTIAVMKLIKDAFVPPVWTTPQPQVLPEPPNKLTMTGLGFYLYHVQENAAFKNYPAPGQDRPPIRFTSLALNLYYQLSANFQRDLGTGALDEQHMMGIAMKTLHDNPVILLPNGPDGSENRCKISLQPIPYSEAVHYWTAGTSPIKLAAYYELHVVLLEPERTQSVAGRVLSYGAFVFPDGMPRISGSRNKISFTIPGTATIQQLTLEPAQVATLGNVDFYGSGYAGDSIALQVYSANWTGALLADSSWNLSLTANNQITVTVPETVLVPGVINPVNVLPGNYTAQVCVSKQLVTSNGETRTIINNSNQFPFTVTPRIDSVVFIAANTVEVKGFFFAFPAPTLPPSVDLFLGATHLVLNAASPGFTVTAQNIIHITLPPAVISGQQIPLRIMIGGAESSPVWIIVP